MERFVITGPSGWIGQALLARLAREPEADLASRVHLFGSRDGTVAVPGGGQLRVKALATIAPDDVAQAHVVHLAYQTKDRAAALGDAAFVAANRSIDDAVLAALEAGRPKSLFVASSGAASLAEQGLDDHLYGRGKLEQEHRFLGWAGRAKVPVLAGRIYNLAGPHANKLEAYAIASFIVQALSGHTIAIAARVPVVRAYLHVEDLCEIVLRAGANGLSRDRPVDLCGEQAVELAQLAQMVADAAGGREVSRGPIDPGAGNVYLGDAADTQELAAALGLSLQPLDRQIAAMIADLSARV